MDSFHLCHIKILSVFFSAMGEGQMGSLILLLKGTILIFIFAVSELEV